MSGAYEQGNFRAAWRVVARLIVDVGSHPPLVDLGM
jgi:hypothetical protein